MKLKEHSKRDSGNHRSIDTQLIYPHFLWGFKAILTERHIELLASLETMSYLTFVALGF